MTFKPLQSLLINSTTRPALNAARIVYIGQAVVGEAGTVISVKEGVLRIGVASSVAAARLKQKEADVIQSINAKLGGEMIKKIKYRVG